MQLKWSDTFNREYENIIACSKNYYGVRKLKTLNRTLRQTEALLINNPHLGKADPILANYDMEYRSILLCTPFKLIYTIYDDCIYLVDIWDTHREPSTLNDRLQNHSL